MSDFPVIEGILISVACAFIFALVVERFHVFDVVGWPASYFTAVHKAVGGVTMWDDSEIQMPVKIGYRRNSNGDIVDYAAKCPICGCSLKSDLGDWNFCPYCGQGIKWEG